VHEHRLAGAEGWGVQKQFVGHSLSLKIKEKVSRLVRYNQNIGKEGETGFGSQKAAVTNIYFFLLSVAGGFPAL